MEWSVGHCVSSVERGGPYFPGKKRQLNCYLVFIQPKILFVIKIVSFVHFLCISTTTTAVGSNFEISAVLFPPQRKRILSKNFL